MEVYDYGIVTVEDGEDLTGVSELEDKGWKLHKITVIPAPNSQNGSIHYYHMKRIAGYGSEYGEGK